MPKALNALSPELRAIPGTVSVWFGRVDAAPVHVRHPDATHYAASTMKVGVMAAAYRMAEQGRLDLDTDIAVHSEFESACGNGATFHNEPSYDNDEQPWQRLGDSAPLRWLVRRMIIMSSNLATNLVIEAVGLANIAEVWRLAGARHSVTTRGIEDYAARDAGKSNLVTVADLAAMLSAVASYRLAGRKASAEMIEVMRAQKANEAFHRALPDGVPAATKSGWVDEIRHSMAIVTPDDAPEFILTTCISSPIEKQAAEDVITQVTRAAWADRRELR